MDHYIYIVDGSAVLLYRLGTLTESARVGKSSVKLRENPSSNLEANQVRLVVEPHS